MMYMIYVMHNLYKDFSLIPYKKIWILRSY